MPKMTRRNFEDVLLRFSQWFDNQDKDNQRDILSRMNRFFDELVAEDAFGTEGQSDPRGDHRDA